MFIFVDQCNQGSVISTSTVLFFLACNQGRFIFNCIGKNPRWAAPKFRTVTIVDAMHQRVVNIRITVMVRIDFIFLLVKT
jgi:hypothetical protein